MPRPILARVAIVMLIGPAAGSVGCLLDKLCLNVAIGLATREAATAAEAQARSEELAANVEQQRGATDWPCPPACNAGLVCVHSELVHRGVCRPECSLKQHRCMAPERCLPVAGAASACLDPRHLAPGGARAEPLVAPPALLDEASPRGSSVGAPPD